MKLTWMGHSCFVVESRGYCIVLDPYEDNSVDGLPPLRLEANEVLCSHEHHDHNSRSSVTLRTGAESPFKVSVLESYHDDQKGRKRGPNRIHILEDGECRIAHMGDLGCMPESEQMERLAGLDALLIPVGGFFTIDALQAKELTQKLMPVVVVPMHYRSEDSGFAVLATVEDYVKLCDDVIYYPGNELEISKNIKKQTAVLKLKK